MVPKKVKLYFVIGILILGVCLFGYFYFKQVPGEEMRPSPLSPLLPPSLEKTSSFEEDFEELEGGKIVEGPKINIYPRPLKLAVRPFKVQAGTSQTLLVAAEDSQGVQKVIAIVEDEVQKEKVAELSLAKGDQKRGLWKGEWKIEKVVNKTYRIIFIIQNQTGTEYRTAIEWEGIQ